MHAMPGASFAFGALRYCKPNERAEPAASHAVFLNCAPHYDAARLG